MSFNSCPCCSSSMLLHLSSRRSYWLCPHCRLEMPDLGTQVKQQANKAIRFNSSPLKTTMVSTKSPQPVVVA
ncbi:MAG: hypothetical protein AAGE84_06680 [Cyanobacteria bacterium P01_G01_bin.39]